jgi:hypothetical protein
MTPIVTLLRLCDGEKPAMGKVYDRMFLLTQKVQKCKASWASKAATLVETRWEYLHSFMHGAGYAFDPEFIENTSEWDAAVQIGAMEIVERLCLRDAMLENIEGHEDPREALTTESKVVVEKVAECEKQLAMYKKRENIFTKGSVLANAKTMPPADWWDMYGLHLPILSRVAKSVLDQVAIGSPLTGSSCPHATPT